ncbi:MAG: FliH/SctL family protein [Armatimonadota bacterium]
MEGGGPQPWRWPRLDGGEEPATGFRPTGPGSEPEPEPASESRQPDGAQAERLIREGKLRAERLVQDACDEAEAIRREAHSEAFEEASAVAQSALEETVAEMTAAFRRAQQELLQRLEAAGGERIDQLERDITRLVAMMTEKVIHRKVRAEDDVVLDVVRATIERAAGADRFIVRVPPPSEPLVREAMAELLAIADGADHLEIAADETIGPGGCIVETERGRFDARIATQMERLAEEISRATGGQEGA